jgi:hypothetical protein
MTACPRFACRLTLAVACLTVVGIAGASALDYQPRPSASLPALAPAVPLTSWRA